MVESNYGVNQLLGKVGHYQKIPERYLIYIAQYK